MSTKKQLHRFGIVRLQHLCGQSRAAKRAKTKLLQESACDSVIRDQEMRSRRMRATSGTDCARNTVHSSGLCSPARPSQSLDSRPIKPTMCLGDVWRRSSPRLFHLFLVFIFLFWSWSCPKKGKKSGQYRLRRPQGSCAAPLNTTQYSLRARGSHLPHRLQAVQETSQP